MKILYEAFSVKSRTFLALVEYKDDSVRPRLRYGFLEVKRRNELDRMKDNDVADIGLQGEFIACRPDSAKLNPAYMAVETTQMMATALPLANLHSNRAKNIRVLNLGLGIGSLPMYAGFCSLNHCLVNLENVTSVEYNPEVCALYQYVADNWSPPHFGLPEWLRNKHSVVVDDAYNFVTSNDVSSYDLVFFDCFYGTGDNPVDRKFGKPDFVDQLLSVQCFALNLNEFPDGRARSVYNKIALAAKNKGFTLAVLGVDRADDVNPVLIGFKNPTKGKENTSFAQVTASWRKAAREWDSRLIDLRQIGILKATRLSSVLRKYRPEPYIV